LRAQRRSIETGLRPGEKCPGGGGGGHVASTWDGVLEREKGKEKVGKWKNGTETEKEISSGRLILGTVWQGLIIINR